MTMLGRVVLILTAGILAAPASGQLGDVLVGTQWVFDTDAVHPGGTVQAALQVRLDKQYHVNSNKPDEDFLIPTVLTVTPPEGFTVSKIVYPEALMITPGFSDVPMSVFEREFVIGVVLEVGPDVAPGTYSITSKLAYQACNDKFCLAPATKSVDSTLKVVPASESLRGVNASLFDRIDFGGGEEPVVAPTPDPETHVTLTPNEDLDILDELEDFDILGTAGGYLNVEDFLQFVDDAESGTTQAGWFDDKGPLVIVLAVILGGILLNLTPCVLPLIPINLAIIGAGAQAGSRARGFALGGTYGLAMAAVYGTLGLIVILTASTFGAINSTIWFNVGITILFIVLGLAMLDVLAIDFSKLQGKLDLAGKGKRGTFALAFGMGGISALLAGACVAPVVIQVIVYSADQYDKGTQIALALPFFLGLGMALPWPFAGGGLSFLPKPGPWMVRVKQAMGVLILAFAGYYGYLAWGIYDSTNVDSAEVMASVEASLAEEGWTASAYQGLAQAKAQDKLVFIDMWAQWCKACKTMNATTLKDEQVVARLADYVKIKYEAPILNEPPARDVLKLFGGIGLPHYAILRPKAEAIAANF
ncbi:MAG: thioredoxin family protein [Planctomycetes bacterium]|nr:thioredoxin family protein [Planctomycetota bacterium]